MVTPLTLVTQLELEVEESLATVDSTVNISGSTTFVNSATDGGESMQSSSTLQGILQFIHGRM